jgi:hypothetical protein
VADLTAYRYRLTREWDAALPPLGWIMLNPSTADDTRDDPTIRKCVGFAKRNGYGAIRVANIIPARSTDPTALQRIADLGIDHPEQAAALRWVWECPEVVTAWGRWGHVYQSAVRAAWPQGTWPPAKARHIGLTKDGHPRHPLMVAYSTPLSSGWEVDP